MEISINTKLSLKKPLVKDHLPSGAVGTVIFIDDFGQCAINWDVNKTTQLTKEEVNHYCTII